MSYMVADIGGTNARFARYRQSDASLSNICTLPTADFDDAETLLAAAKLALGTDEFDGICLAIAGPVREGSGAITNGRLQFDEQALSVLTNTPVKIVNDFYALARAVPYCTDLLQLGGQVGDADTIALIGPGTGLGMAVLLRDGKGWRVLPSEGGHADLAPGNPLEQEILGILGSQGHVCWETVLCGSGLARLYLAVASVWGVNPAKPLTAAEIVSAGTHADDPMCHQTLELFFALLGSAAGNLALTVCAESVYIGGGIVPRLMDFALTSPFRRRFEERGDLQYMMQAMPVYVILDEYPGLLGAANCL